MEGWGLDSTQVLVTPLTTGSLEDASVPILRLFAYGRAKAPKRIARRPAPAPISLSAREYHGNKYNGDAYGKKY